MCVCVCVCVCVCLCVCEEGGLPVGGGSEQFLLQQAWVWKAQKGMWGVWGRGPISGGGQALLLHLLPRGTFRNPSIFLFVL